MIPRLNLDNAQPLPKVRLEDGSYTAQLGRVNFNEKLQRLYIPLVVNGQPVDPYASVDFDNSKPWFEREVTRYRSFLAAIGHTEKSFLARYATDPRKLAELAGSWVVVHVRNGDNGSVQHLFSVESEL